MEHVPSRVREETHVAGRRAGSKTALVVTEEFEAPVSRSSGGRDTSAVATDADVRRIALSLPEVVERPSYGTPGFRVGDRLFARIREEGDVLVVWCESLEDKEALIASEPGKFFSTPHYDGHSSVLVRLDAVDETELGELLTDAWLLRAPKRLAAAFDSRRDGS